MEIAALVKLGLLTVLSILETQSQPLNPIEQQTCNNIAVLLHEHHVTISIDSDLG